LISTVISRASASLLLVGGAALLFAPEASLAPFGVGLPVNAHWVAQLLGGAWLGAASLNWLQRSALLGGIYGRPIVSANLGIYFIGAMVILRAAQRSGFPRGLVMLAVPAVVMAVVYGALLLRGPFERNLAAGR
jgi:hypothetical protein